MLKRVFFIAAAAFAGLVAVSSRRGKEEESVDNEDRVVRTPAEWKARLTAQQYYVTRQGSTDSPFTGTYHSLKTKGEYLCVCCDLLLFRADEKFDSGTGWPSFWGPAVARNIKSRKDVSMFLERTEVSCRRCDAHLGHVFPDGPPPTELRYCINESSLRFLAG